MKLAGIIALCVVAALLQIHLLQMASPLLESNLPIWIDTAWKHHQDSAMFHWSGYQSRMLGVGLIVAAGGDLRAYIEVTCAALVLAGLLSWRLAGIAGLAILHACFAVFASPWFAPWDMFELAIFIGFVVLVVEGWSWPWFVGLFAIAIFNLQSAMFIALWMVMGGMWRAGLVCIAFGIVVMWWFQHSGQPRLGFTTFQCLDRQTTGLSTDYAQERLIENWHKLFVLDSRAVLGVIAVIGYSAIRIMKEQAALGLTFLALLGATIVFGIVDEMRCYLPFVSLLILVAT